MFFTCYTVYLEVTIKNENIFLASLLPPEYFLPAVATLTELGHYNPEEDQDLVYFGGIFNWCPEVFLYAAALSLTKTHKLPVTNQVYVFLKAKIYLSFC